MLEKNLLDERRARLDLEKKLAREPVQLPTASMNGSMNSNINSVSDLNDVRNSLNQVRYAVHQN
jgi:hypothetical protein